MRSSPIICITDTSSLIFRLLRSLIRDKKSVEEAMSEIYSLPISSSLVYIREQSTLKKHPIAFLLWFLGTATQAIKIFGFQGNGLWWAKAIAGVYISSYIIPVGILAQLPYDPDSLYTLERRRGNIDHRSHESMIIARISTVAAIIHVLVACYAIFQVTHIRGVDTFCHDPNSGLVLARACVSTAITVLVITILPVALLLSFIAISLIELLSEVAVRHGIFAIKLSALHPYIYNGIRGVIYVASLIGVTVVYFNYRWMMAIGNVLVQGGFLIFCGVVTCVALCVGWSWFLIKIDRGGIYWVYSWLECFAVVFASVSLVVAGLYCCFVYNSTGTIKPSWTDKLG